MRKYVKVSYIVTEVSHIRLGLWDARPPTKGLDRAADSTYLSQTSLPYVPAFYACFTGALHLCLSSRQDKGRGLSETKITDQELGLRHRAST